MLSKESGKSMQENYKNTQSDLGSHESLQKIPQIFKNPSEETKDPGLEDKKNEKFSGELILKELAISNQIENANSPIGLIVVFGRILIYLTIQIINYEKFKWYKASDGFILMSLLALTVTLHRLNVDFITFGIIDFRRKLFYQEALSALIETNKKKLKKSEHFQSIPTMNILDPENLRNWMDLRKLSLDLGKKYTYRVFLYSSIFLSIYGSLALFFALVFFNILDYDIPVSVSLLGYYDVFAVIGIMIYMLRIGAEVNSYFSVHKEKLISLKTNFIKIKHNYDNF